MNAQQYALQRQFVMLRKLKRATDKKLRDLHDRIFIGTKYAVKIPKWMHRSIVERRLFYYYCMTHYHYDSEHPIAQEFKRKAEHILSPEYLEGLDPKEVARQQIKDGLHFTASHIKAMPIVQVDRYLASLSLFVEGTERLRRKVLWEWFNKPANELPKHLDDAGKMVRARRTNRLNNKYRLRDLILEHPTLGYDDFMEAFGEQMPTVSRASYNNARCLLRSVGYDIPELRKGRRGPAVVRGPSGQKTRGRLLNDVALLTTKQEKDEQEPF